MVMRGGSRRAGSGLAIAVRHFEWSTTQTATLRHSTLPWFDGFADSISLPASHLGDARELGKRDRLSLVGQFAAHHQCYLAFDQGQQPARDWRQRHSMPRDDTQRPRDPRIAQRHARQIAGSHGVDCPARHNRHADAG